MASAGLAWQPGGMAGFDYVIVGAGPAGCVLANRLSADPEVEVLLVEAGDRDSNPLIAMPRGFGELLGDPATAWHYPTRPFGPAQQVEYWVRGKTLGGSSSINGMIYTRGQRADYDALERLGNPGWGWDDMLPVYRTIEDNELGASDVRGAGGPLHVSTVGGTDPLLEDVLTAGTQLGWRRTRDVNETDEERIGYAMATIRDGRRCSAADAFLHPVMDRPNLTVALHTLVDRVVLEGGRAIGVQGRRNGQGAEAVATREVILATGSIATPKILQLSGIGPADTLRSAGVDVVVDSPNVGARAREHRVFLHAVPARRRPRLQHSCSAPKPASRRRRSSTRRPGAGRWRHPRPTSSGSSRPARSSTAPTPRSRSRRSRCCHPNPVSRSRSSPSRA